MGIPNRQIGWSQESNLLWYILSQLKKLTSIIFSLKEAATPKYKVFTALLTQAGGDNVQTSNAPNSLTIGVTYFILQTDTGCDFTNVGAPNNNVGTYFVATGTTPNSWGESVNAALEYNLGAPVATVLENTIGNVWFTYYDVGQYLLNYGDFPKEITTKIMETPYGKSNDPCLYTLENNSPDILISTLRIEFGVPKFDYVNGYLNNTFIEIKVYN